MRTKDELKGEIKRRLARVLVEQWAPIYNEFNERRHLATDVECAEIDAGNKAVIEIYAELDGPVEKCDCADCN